MKMQIPLVAKVLPSDTHHLEPSPNSCHPPGPHSLLVSKGGRGTWSRLNQKGSQSCRLELLTLSVPAGLSSLFLFSPSWTKAFVNRSKHQLQGLEGWCRFSASTPLWCGLGWTVLSTVTPNGPASGLFSLDRSVPTCKQFGGLQAPPKAHANQGLLPQHLGLDCSLGWSLGLSWALQSAEQRPWPLLTPCQGHPPAVTTTDVSSQGPVSPGGRTTPGDAPMCWPLRLNPWVTSSTRLQQQISAPGANQALLTQSPTRPDQAATPQGFI